MQYRSAGTVEFIVDAKRNFYFLEMNTRLQVEHPVTELATGLDLVELMIRIAAGEKLKLSQEQIQLTGSAIEARVYAEDPARNFVPSIGRLVRYRPPAEDDTVRVDTGVYEGAEISMYYDPMIAKLVTFGATRDAAIARMEDALDAFLIRGVAHNVPFLSAILRSPRRGVLPPAVEIAAGDAVEVFGAGEIDGGLGGFGGRDHERSRDGHAEPGEKAVVHREVGVDRAGVEGVGGDARAGEAARELEGEVEIGEL